MIRHNISVTLALIALGIVISVAQVSATLEATVEPIRLDATDLPNLGRSVSKPLDTLEKLSEVDEETQEDDKEEELVTVSDQSITVSDDDSMDQDDDDDDQELVNNVGIPNFYQLNETGSDIDDDINMSVDDMSGSELEETSDEDEITKKPSQQIGFYQSLGNESDIDNDDDDDDDEEDVTFHDSSDSDLEELEDNDNDDDDDDDDDDEDEEFYDIIAHPLDKDENEFDEGHFLSTAA